MIERDDDLFVNRLARYDEQRAADPDDDGLSPELRSKLDRAIHCLDVLEQARLDEISTLGGGSTLRPPGPFGDRPAKIDRYEIIRELGRGGYGVVFLAKDPDLGRQVALKVPRAETLISDDARERFEREARASAALNHVGIVPIFEARSVGPVAFMASAFCEGVSLSQRIEDETWTPVAAAELVAQLAEAVQHAHGRGILHRDLKPSNVLMDQGQPKITDFGLAKMLEAADSDATREGTTLGTPAYMSPEQARGEIQQLAVTTDIYSLGAVLYELLANRPPFREESVLATLRAVEQKVPAPPSRWNAKVPRDLDAVCLKCLEKDPTQRYPSATALAEDLRRFVAGRPVRARTVGAAERTLRWCRANPIVSALACLVFLFAIGASIAAWQTNTALQRAVSAESDLLERTEEAEQRLADSLIMRAKLRRNGTIGQARQGLELLDNAIALVSPDQRSPEFLHSFRTEFFACSNVFDLDPIDDPWLARFEQRGDAMAYSADRTTLAITDQSGRVLVSDSETPGQTKSLSIQDRVSRLQLSRTGRFLATLTQDAWVIWDVRANQSVYNKRVTYRYPLEFNPDETMVAVCDRRFVELIDLSSGEIIHRTPTTSRFVSFSPSGNTLAFGEQDERLAALVLLDVPSLEIERIPFREMPGSAAWNASETEVIGATGVSVYRCRLDKEDEPPGQRSRSAESRPRFSAMPQRVTGARFMNEDSLVAVATEEPAITVLSADFGRELLRIPLTADSTILPALDQLQVRTNAGKAIPLTWGFRPQFHHSLPMPPRDAVGDTVNDPLGRFTSFNTGLRIEFRSRDMTRSLGMFETQNTAIYSYRLDEQGKRLLVSVGKRIDRETRETRNQFLSFDLRIEEERVALGKPELIAPERVLCYTPNASHAVTFRTGNPRYSVIDLRSGEVIRQISRPVAAIAPDVSWCVASMNDGSIHTHKEPYGICDLAEERFRLELPLQIGADGATISPDGRWLILADVDQYRLLSTDDWSEHLRIEEVNTRHRTFPMAFSSDSRMAAVMAGRGSITLIDVASATRILTLDAPASTRCLAFSADGRELFAGTSSQLHRWELEPIREGLLALDVPWLENPPKD